jgi:hypothetical protein
MFISYLTLNFTGWCITSIWHGARRETHRRDTDGHPMTTHCILVTCVAPFRENGVTPSAPAEGLDCLELIFGIIANTSLEQWTFYR